VDFHSSSLYRSQFYSKYLSKQSRLKKPICHLFQRVYIWGSSMNEIIFLNAEKTGAGFFSQ